MDMSEDLKERRNIIGPIKISEPLPSDTKEWKWIYVDYEGDELYRDDFEEDYYKEESDSLWFDLLTAREIYMITQKQLAFELDISVSTISKIENGHTNLHKKTRSIVEKFIEKI